MTPRAELVVGRDRYSIVDLSAAAGADLARLPVIHRILLENVLRRGGEDGARARGAILRWLETGTSEEEIPFHPSRLLMHDTTCGPALVDIAAMRSALAEAGLDPARLNPVLPVDVSTDHSLAVDAFARPDARDVNERREYERNAERYRFMKWAAQALKGFRAHPPGSGIMHTLNLESLATVVSVETREGADWLIPDAMLGTDSHTPMINGIGVLAWGVGGVEAESVMFGMSAMLRVPDVVGVKLIGRLRPGVLATDLALTITQALRRVALADRFVEFHGPGVSALSAGERAVVANMAPEFGANSGYFPIDAETLRYLEATGRGADHLARVEAYARRQKLWFDPQAEPVYTSALTLDLDAVEVSVAGPRRPQDRHPAGASAQAFAAVARPVRSFTQPENGAVAIAAITSCTNTSDPRLLIAAGLLARKARARGLKPAPWVKTSMAPGSPTAQAVLERAGLREDLDALGFGVVGYGCTTCIGNSGPLTGEIETAMARRGVVPVAVLSGNRNFPGRVHPALEAGFLASPPLVVAFALAGDVAGDIMNDPLGRDHEGRDVRLADLWPSGEEIDAALAKGARPTDYAPAYARADASARWRDLDAPAGALFPWDDASTYIRRPPFARFDQPARLGRYAAHPILVVGDDVTTDHISPAGQIARAGEAADYLIQRGERADDLNVFSARRGNWEAMLRGLFTNRAVKNLLGEAIAPGSTVMAGTRERLPLWTAAARYAEAGRSVVVVAGERYGMGSSRDWAAKGVALLGARAVLASSFERIHRSNLIGMGVLPLRLPEGVTPFSLALSPDDLIEIDAPLDALRPRARVGVRVRKADGGDIAFDAAAAIETGLEVATLAAGGLLPLILRRAREG